MKKANIIIGNEYWCSLWYKGKFRPRRKTVVGIKNIIPFVEMETGEYINLESVFADAKECSIDCANKNSKLTLVKNDIQKK